MKITYFNIAMKRRVGVIKLNFILAIETIIWYLYLKLIVGFLLGILRIHGWSYMKTSEFGYLI